MTSPDTEPIRLEPGPFEPDPLEGEPQENVVIGWAKAIVFGIGDTARDMLDAGREGAREAMDEQWERFDRKTKHRRD